MTPSQSIEEAMSHLGAALMQTVPTDDQIIMEHVRAAHSLLKDVHRKEAEQQRANEVMA